MSSGAQGLNASQHVCLHHLLLGQAERIPDAPAIIAPGRAPLTYGRLYKHVDDTVQTLYSMGVGRKDRVALALPNGAEMAVAFLAVAATATCTPLNPAYSADEFAFYLAHLHTQVLIVQADISSPARDVARARGLRIIELSPMLETEAGLFTLIGEKHPYAAPLVFAQPDDTALVLHTTGSTSRPKIVPLTHTNLCASAYNIQAALGLVTSDRCLNVLPLFHAHGLKGMVLSSLAAGASIMCTPGFSAPEFFAWMAEFRPTWYSAVPTIHQAILAHAALYRQIIASCPLRFIRSTSAFLPPKVLGELEQVFNAPVIESYGTTEASMVTCNPLPPRARKIGSGGIAAGVQVAIMDEMGTLLPAGETGEIVVRGAAVMQGYENDPTANQSAFTHGWFRVGDQGYVDADGYLFITGRMKEMINRGGEKIAPQEVDDVLMDHPAVAQAVTFAIPHARLGEDIAAAVVLHPNAAATDSDIRQFAATRLAAFKVPRQVLIVDDIPKSATGKLQRLGLTEKLGLTAPDRALPAMPADFTVPRTPVEEVLVGVWTQVLAVDRVGIHDNFTQLGGDSILATQLISRVREVLHCEISFSSFFEAPTVAGMARSIEAIRQATLGLRVPPLQAVLQDGLIPLSYAQQRLWFIEQLGLSGHAYHLLEVMRLRGPLRVAGLAQSLQEITRRHAVLRTTFTEVEGQPRQVIQPAMPLPLPIVELGELSACEQEAQIHTLARIELQKPFDLAHGPLVRATLLRLAAEEHVLLLTLHHIVSDGWSHGVFWRELTVLYEAFAAGKPAVLPELTIQYADFAHWQRQWLQGEVLDTQLTYWNQQLAGVSMLQMSTDRPRPTVQTFRGARHPLGLSTTLTQALKTLSQRHGVTLFMTLLAAFQTLLHRYTSQDDILVGTLIANRNRVETEELIGFLVNTVALRTDFSGNPRFRELLERVRKVTLGAYSHQDLPFEKLLEVLRPQRDLSRTPLLQVLFVLQNTPWQVPAMGDLTLCPLEVDPETAKFDVTLNLLETPEGLRGWFEYSTDLFEAATIARMGEHLQTLLEGVVADPEQRLSMLPLLTADERHHLLVGWNDTKANYPQDACIQDLFEAQAEGTPDAIAVVCGGEHLTYRELNRSANQLAHYLSTLGVGPGMLVGICLPRSLDLIVGLLGVLKAGAIYLPLDPMYPKERLAFMLADAQVSVLLTQRRLMETLPDRGTQCVCLDSERQSLGRQSAENPRRCITAEALAYVIYTSGSTGQPKGVMVSHKQVLNRLAWMWETYPFEADETCCHKTPLSFVDSVWEIFGPLLQGIPTVMIPNAILKDPLQLVHTLADMRVTRIVLVPSLLRVILDTNDDLQRRLPHLKYWVSSGEILSVKLCQDFRERMPQSILLNLYGSSEVAADATWYDTRRSESLRCVPIGRPIANMQIYVLDAHLQQVPIGVPGELYVGGLGLAQGYLNHPEWTAEKFIPHSFSEEPGARLYKTGDLARYLPDGNIEYLGRLDQQVKLRGIRIELGEIEAALGQHPLVRETVVVAREEVSGELRLVAYLVPAQEQTPTAGELRRWLKKTLADYMIPAAFIWLDIIPLTPNGKVDRRALPVADPIRPDLEETFVAPRTPIEQQVAAIWCRLLGLEQIGIRDNFFELGGHSLLAVQLMSRIRAATHVEVSLLSFFETPTVLGIAKLIEEARQAEQSPPAPAIVPIPRERALPASVAQEQLWIVNQVLPGIPSFHISQALRLLGTLNLEALEQSCNEIVRRHEALRTTFALVDGQLVQIISPTLHVTLAVADLRVLPEVKRAGEARRAAAAEAQQPFDLAQGPLLRASLLRLGEQEHMLLLTMHHIISDGWSMGVLTQELLVLYDAFAAGEPSPLPELSIQYADFAHWQRQWRHSAAMQAQLAYWQEQLHDPLPMLELPTDRPRGAALSFHAAREDLTVSGALSEALKNLSWREGITLFMTLVAACKMLFYSYTGQEDLRVATLVANRTCRETEALIGLLVNTVILRTNLSASPTCREVLQRVRATTVAAYAHQDLPFEDLVSALEHERHLDRRSLCQVMIMLQNATLRPAQPTASTPRLLKVEQSLALPDMALTTFDLVLVLRDRPQGLAGSCIYRTALFDPTTVHRLLGDFQQVLACLVAQPEQPLATLCASLVSSEHGFPELAPSVTRAIL